MTGNIPDSTKPPEIIRDAKGKIVKPIPQETNKNGTAGHPSKYDPKYCQEIIDFFDIDFTKEYVYETVRDKRTGTLISEKRRIVANDLPTFLRFAMKIGVNVDTLHEWKRDHPEFSEAYKKAKEIQKNFWIHNSLSGLFNPAFTIFFGKNVFGFKDKVETDVTSKGKEVKGLTVGVVSYDKK